MTTHKSSLKTLNILLWIAQILLAAIFFMVGSLNTFLPISDLIERGIDYNTALIRFIGVSELLGAVGLIFPALLRIKPILSIWAAIGIAVIMVLAVGYHISQNDFAHSWIPALLGLIAVFIAWGRSKKVPVPARV